MKQAYRSHRFSSNALNQIELVNQIIEEYEEQNFKLTVRQLYYQLVARDVIPNSEKSYKQLISLVTNGRMAGLIDWDMIEDRTREFIVRPHWDSPGSIVSACAKQFHMDMWDNQNIRPFVVVEKEALVNVFEGVCHSYDVPLLPARGYPSMSVVREFAENTLLPAIYQGQEVILFHFGDHDPSGIDMTRDLMDRLSLFISGDMNIERMALNMPQIVKLNPPPNPAKTTDKRFASYAKTFGTNKSWELDALPPSYLEKLAKDAIEGVIEWDQWEKRQKEISSGRDKIAKVASKLEK